MEQLRFFEITKDDWDFLLLYQEAKKEYKGLVEVHESYLDLQSEFTKHLNDHNLLLRNNIIEIKDIRMKKRLSDDLKIVQKELFLRKGNAFDIVTLYRLPSLTQLRVSSNLAQHEMISLRKYGKLLTECVEGS